MKLNKFLIASLLAMCIIGFSMSSVSAFKVNMHYPTSGQYRFSGDNVGVALLTNDNKFGHWDSYKGHYHMTGYYSIIVGSSHIQEAPYRGYGTYLDATTDNGYQRGENNTIFFNLSSTDKYLTFYANDCSSGSGRYSYLSIKLNPSDDNEVLDINYYDRGYIRDPHIDATWKGKLYDGKNGDDVIIS